MTHFYVSSAVEGTFAARVLRCDLRARSANEMIDTRRRDHVDDHVVIGRRGINPLALLFTKLASANTRPTSALVRMYVVVHVVHIIKVRSNCHSTYVCDFHIAC